MPISTFDTVVLGIEGILYTFHFSLFWLLCIQKDQRFKGAVYNLFRIIFIADFIFTFTKVQTKLPSFGIIPNFYKNNGWLATLWFNGSGYFVFLQFIAHTLIAFNRFTLFWFPVLYSKIWSRQWYTVLVLIFPLIVLSHRLIEPGIFQYSSNGEVIVRLVNDYAVSATYAVSSGFYFTCTAIQAVFNILAMLKYKNYKKSNISARKNDMGLLYISFIFFVIQLFRSIFNFIRPYFTNNPEMAYFLQAMVPIIADIYQGTGSVSLILLSPSTRKAYFSYYGRWCGISNIVSDAGFSVTHKITVTTGQKSTNNRFANFPTVVG